MADRIGSAAPRAAVADVLASHQMPDLADSRSLLLLWLAGPYLPVDGRPEWLATEPRRLIAETNRLLHDDGGVRVAEQVAKELEHHLGVAPQHVKSWLLAQPVQAIEGLLVVTSGAPGDVAERALCATGRAMTVEELARWTRSSGRPSGGANGTDGLWALLRRDRRFVEIRAD